MIRKDALCFLLTRGAGEVSRMRMNDEEKDIPPETDRKEVARISDCCFSSTRVLSIYCFLFSALPCFTALFSFAYTHSRHRFSFPSYVTIQSKLDIQRSLLQKSNLQNVFQIVPNTGGDNRYFLTSEETDKRRSRQSAACPRSSSAGPPNPKNMTSC